VPDRLVFLAKKVSSSIGRAAVSKTAGWGFESLLTCCGKLTPGEDFEMKFFVERKKEDP
jgi:hypothetical protein